jgi:uncharacterized protein YdgA (DUF945 family)
VLASARIAVAEVHTVKKGLIIFLVVAALIVLVSPGIIGRIAEQSVDESFEWADAETEEIIVTSEHFDRGWFSSEGRHRVEIRDPEIKGALYEIFGEPAADGNPVFVVETRIDHGLIPVTSMTREKGSLAPGLGRGVSTMTVEIPGGEVHPIPGAIYSDIELDGMVAANYVLQPGSHEAGESSASWGSADISFTTDPSAEAFVVDGDIESVSLVDGPDTLNIGRTTFSANQKPTRFGFAVGDFEMSMASVSVEENGVEVVSFGPFLMSGDSEIDGERINGRGEMSMDGVAVPGYGDMGLDVAVRFTGIYAQSLGRVVAALETVDDNTPPQELMVILDEDLKKLVASGLEVNFERFDFKLPQGPVSTRINVAVEESDPANFVWTSALLDMTADADLTVSAEFVDFAMMMNPQAGALVNMGLLRKNGEVYEMRTEYAKGLLTVNGAPMPIPLGQ